MLLPACFQHHLQLVMFGIGRRMSSSLLRMLRLSILQPSTTLSHRLLATASVLLSCITGTMLIEFMMSSEHSSAIKVGITGAGSKIFRRVIKTLLGDSYPATGRIDGNGNHFCS